MASATGLELASAVVDKKQEICEMHEYSTTNDLSSEIGDEDSFQRHSRSLVRKLDMTLMPTIWILYMFNYLDRNNIR